MNYHEFIKQKLVSSTPTGLEPKEPIHTALFDFQRNVVEIALRRGRFALFLDTGLGKTICQLEWARHVPGKVLILAPLAVAEQTRREASKLGMDINHSKDGTVKGKITVTNYERLHHFETTQFHGVVLDESSILKSFVGRTKRLLCETFAQTPFRLCCTATPAPNDYMELGNHSEFLGVKTNVDMLATWFINDSANTGMWKLKGHATKSFWEWVGSWAACAEKPSDAGGDDTRFALPPLDVRLNTVETDYSTGADEGYLFRVPEMSATSMHREKKNSLIKRVESVLNLCRGEGFRLVWCETNDESKLISEALGSDCVEVTGADSIDRKEDKLTAFSLGKIRCMVTKPTIAGFGLNWQHCNHQIFASLSYSYEQFYQAVRRSWRFGQKNPVRADIVIAEAEMPLWRVISEKMNSHRAMKDAMKYAKLSFSTQAKSKTDYNPQHKGRLPIWLKAA